VMAAFARSSGAVLTRPGSESCPRSPGFCLASGRVGHRSHRSRRPPTSASPSRSPRPRRRAGPGSPRAAACRRASSRTITWSASFSDGPPRSGQRPSHRMFAQPFRPRERGYKSTPNKVVSTNTPRFVYAERRETTPRGRNATRMFENAGLRGTRPNRGGISWVTSIS